MKKSILSFISLTLVLCTLLCACGKENAQSNSVDESKENSVLSTTDSTDSSESSSEKVVNQEYKFNATCIRTNYKAGIKAKTTVIDNAAGLTSYYLENKREYGLTDEFKKRIGNYTDEFFSDKIIVMIALTTNSGSTRFEVQKCVTAETEGEKKLSIHIDHKQPPVYAMDMAAWHIIVEVDKTCATAPENIELVINYKEG